MNRTRIALVSLLAVGLLAAAAQATSLGSVKLRYYNASPRQAGQAWLDGSYLGVLYTGMSNLQLDPSYDPDRNGTPGAGEGELLYGMAEDNGWYLGGYCVDVRQYAVTNYRVYDVLLPAEAPVGGSNPLGGMGQQAATDLAKLFASKESLVTDKNTAAAFQAAVWEIATETSGTYDVTSGAFRMQEKWGSGWLSLANSWLSGLQLQTEPFIGLRALASEDAQDFAIVIAGTSFTGEDEQVIPEPVTVLGVLGGLAGLGAYWKKRRAAAQAA